MLRYTYIGDTIDNKSSSLHGQEVGPGFNKRCTVYLDNAARCGTWAGTQPTKTQYLTCSPKLLDTFAGIKSVHGRVLVLLTGAAAINSFYTLVTGKGSSANAAFDRSGHILELPNSLGPVQVFSTYHPAFIIRKNAIIEAVVDHLHLVSDALDGTLAVPSKPAFMPAGPPTPELIALCRRRIS